MAEGGRFIGEVKTRWLQHEGRDREMELLTDFVFVDSRGVEWLAAAGSTVDGASIPDWIWSKAIGTPFIGDYRRASVVHDVACKEKTRPHEQVHRMFYDAMIADGVAKKRAMSMYTAVRLFGPKWGVDLMVDNVAVVEFDIDELAATLDRALAENTPR
jgi:hypothetical protein